MDLTTKIVRLEGKIASTEAQIAREQANLETMKKELKSLRYLRIENAMNTCQMSDDQLLAFLDAVKKKGISNVNPVDFASDTE